MSESGVLYHRGKSGAIYSWRSWVEGAFIHTEYGLLDGKKQVTARECFPKNVGKRNATTAEEQAQAELESLYTFQLDRKYSRTIEDAETPLMLPMLAKDFEKRKDKVTYPCHIQPKLDGVRCMAFRDESGEIVLLSRSGKPYNVPHIKIQVGKLLDASPEGIILDGELYIHDETFQTITSWVKKLRPETAKIEYWIYDVPRDAPWVDRDADLMNLESAIRNQNLHSLKIVETEQVNSEDEVYEVQSEYCEDGYEGAILRTLDHVYRFGYRSSGLLKVKSFQDAEYRIVGYRAGQGSYSNCVIWECLDEATQKRFNVNPQGTFDQKREWLLNAEDYVGSLLKVKYFELTDDGLPRFPVGIGFRMMEDM